MDPHFAVVRLHVTDFAGIERDLPPLGDEADRRVVGLPAFQVFLDGHSGCDEGREDQQQEEGVQQQRGNLVRGGVEHEGQSEQQREVLGAENGQREADGMEDVLPVSAGCELRQEIAGAEHAGQKEHGEGDRPRSGVAQADEQQGEEADGAGPPADREEALHVRAGILRPYKYR